MDGQQESRQGRTVTRRDALRSGGVVLGAAALWSTPVVHFVGATPAAAATPPPTVDLCPSTGQPKGLVFAYLPNPKGFFDFGPSYTPSGPGMSNEPVFSGSSVDLVGRAVKIEFWANNSGLGSGSPNRILVPVGSSESGSNVVKSLPAGGLASGQTFVPGDLHPNGRAGPNNAFRITDEFGNVQFFTFHTSCSKDLETGFIFGSVQLVDGLPA